MDLSNNTISGNITIILKYIIIILIVIIDKILL